MQATIEKHERTSRLSYFSVPQKRVLGNRHIPYVGLDLHGVIVKPIEGADHGGAIQQLPMVIPKRWIVERP